MIFPILFIHFASSVAQNPSSYNAKGWEKTGKYLSQYMDRSVDPCANFTGFVCGHFGNASDKQRYQSWEDERAKIYKTTILDAINGINVNNTKTPPYAIALRSFYDACLKYKSDNASTKLAFDMLTEELGPFPPFFPSLYPDATVSNETLDVTYMLIGKAQRRLGEPLFLKAMFDVSQDGEGNRLPKLSIQPVIPKYLATYYVDLLRNATLIIGRVMNITLNRTYFEEVLSEADAFLSEWQTVIDEPPAEEEYTYFSTNTANLSTEFPSVRWQSYLAGLLTKEAKESLSNDSNVVMTIVNSDQLENRSEVIARYSSRAVKTAMYAWFLGTFVFRYSARDLEKMFWLRTGFSRKDLCVEYAVQYMSPAAARVYFEHIGEDIIEFRNQMRLVGQNVFSAMRLLLNSIAYISPETKERINEKIDSIKLNPSVPSWIVDDEKVLALSGSYNNSQSFFVNDINRRRSAFLEEQKKLVNPEIIEEPTPTFESNDFYVPDSNNIQIHIYLGDNLPPQFSTSAPMVHKYGTLGWTIGHELMHAFDPSNVMLNAAQEATNLQQDEFEIYERHKQCLVQQYSSTCYKKLRGCIVGAKAIHDNVADVGGLKAAYAAYQFTKALTGEEKPIPGLTEYTSDQLFFISFQRYFCTRNDPKGLLTSDHTANSARGIVALRNNPHFAEAFKCEVGSDAAPVKSCQLWGDVLSSSDGASFVMP